MTATGDSEPAGRQDRRDVERVAVLGELEGEVMVLQPMAITEIGRGGVQVETTFPFQINSLHELRLALGDRPIVVKGRVIHCSIIDVEHEFVRYRSGIEFTDVSGRIDAVITAFVTAIKDGRRGA
jgi:PilZ domain-containing protein